MATLPSTIRFLNETPAMLNQFNTSINIVAASFEQMIQSASLDSVQREMGGVNREIEKQDRSVKKLKETWGGYAKGLSSLGIHASAKAIFSGVNDKRVAQNTLQARTGLQGDDLAGAQQAMTNLYTDGMGSDWKDTANSLAQVYQLTGKTGEGLEQTTRAGMLLRDMYGYDIKDSLLAAEQLEKQYGVSGAQAFDMIAQATQAGLNKNGDLLNRLDELNGFVSATTDHLEMLNGISYDNATSALSSLARTINDGLAGVIGNTVNAITGRLNDFTTGLQGKADQIQGIFGWIGLAAGAVGGVIAGGWSLVEPVLWGIVAALAVYRGALLISNGLEVVSKGIKMASSAVLFMQAVAIRKVTEENIKDTVAQLGLNTAILACPITWIIMGIIALVAVIYTVIAAINKVQGTSISAMGMIMGAFSAAGAFVGNLFLGIVELVFGIMNLILNIFGTLGAFIGNVFKDPVGSIVHLFYDLGDLVLGVLETIVGALDFIFGSHMANAVDGWRKNLQSMAETATEKAGNGTYESIEKVDMHQMLDNMGISIERLRYDEAYQSGYDFGEGAGKKLGGVFDGMGSLFSGDGSGGMESVKGAWDGIYQNTGTTVGNTGTTAGNTAAMADTMNLMDEDLKYMRDVAEQEVINRFTLAELKVDVNNNNTLRTKTDFDDVNRRLGQVTSEILSAAAEGVYA